MATRLLNLIQELNQEIKGLNRHLNVDELEQLDLLFGRLTNDIDAEYYNCDNCFRTSWLDELRKGVQAMAKNHNIELPNLKFSNKLNDIAISVNKLGNKIEEERQKLFISNELLSTAQKIAKLGHWQLNLTTNELVWSDEIYKIFEIDPDKFEANYEAFLDRVHPDDRELVDKEYLRSVETGEPYKVSHRIAFPDGRIKYVEERGYTFKNKLNQKISVGTVQDLTDNFINSKLAEDVFEFGNVGVMIFEDVTNLKDLVPTRINKAACEIFGYSEEELKNLNFKNIVYPDDQGIINEKYQQLLEGKIDSVSVIRRHVKKGGKLVYAKANLSVVRNNNLPILLILQLTDLSDLMTAQKEASSWKTRYHIAVNNSGMLLYDWDMRTDRVELSEALYEMLGYNVEDITTLKDWVDIVYEDDEDIFDELIENLKNNVPKIDFIYRVWTKDGKLKFVRDRGDVIYDEESGEGIKMIGLIEDITEQREIEEKLKTSLDRLDLLNQITLKSATDESTLDELYYTILTLINKFVGFDLAHIYNYDEESETLYPSDIWVFKPGKDHKFKSFVEITQKTAFKAEEGVPGSVFNLKKARWIEDVQKELDFSRNIKSNAVKVKGAIAFPVIQNGIVSSVFEFFSENEEKTNFEVLDLISNISSQINHIIDRKRAHEVIATSKKRYKLLAENSLDLVCVQTMEGICEWVSPSIKTLLGFSENEVIGADVGFLFRDTERKKK